MYSKRLYQIRDRNNIYQCELANYLKISESLYSRYEKEIQIIPIKHLNSLANYFGVSLDYFFGFTDILNYKKYRQNINEKLMASRLKELRSDNKLTQIKLAQILNVAKGTIANYECGLYPIATPFLYDICKKYKVSADYLLGRIDCFL